MSCLHRLIHARKEIEDGDYVTLSRIFHGFEVTEVLMTFSDVSIERSFYACDATTFRKGEENTRERNADFFEI